MVIMVQNPLLSTRASKINKILKFLVAVFIFRYPTCRVSAYAYFHYQLTCLIFSQFIAQSVKFQKNQIKKNVQTQRLFFLSQIIYKSSRCLNRESLSEFKSCVASNLSHRLRCRELLSDMSLNSSVL